METWSAPPPPPPPPFSPRAPLTWTRCPHGGREAQPPPHALTNGRPPTAPRQAEEEAGRGAAPGHLPAPLVPLSLCLPPRGEAPTGRRCPLTANAGGGNGERRVSNASGLAITWEIAEEMMAGRFWQANRSRLRAGAAGLLGLSCVPGCGNTTSSSAWLSGSTTG